ncbi:TPA: fimbria/pilus periplasmic chaperone [Pseudomonas aeruginosa]|nr:fimbria/pilus periplasmic chaperone [Pseudomonas aeruginosa]
MRIFVVMARFLLVVFLVSSLNGYTSHALAGVALGATRVIYPAGKKQVQLAVTNNDEQSTYLIHSWLEDAEGKKASEFVITPPLFAMQGKKENTLRIIDATNQKLPQDRESLYWLNVKAIPSMDKSKMSENTLQLAIISRIKFYYRPSDLDLSPDQAAEKLSFRRSGGRLVLSNSSPYYLTVTELKAGDQELENTLVPPKGEITVSLPVGAGREISYRTINDYGALTMPMNSIAK